ncbi:transcription factor Sp5-like [Penaeus japonicus]|uniref:transcription factor Sp5-like n=1 Tax=Penaeus japonicus TaxID=27405 RepID=UPI001C714C9D|nr:transcription factor Sp5-like [Penaeus japonicus]
MGVEVGGVERLWMTKCRYGKMVMLTYKRKSHNVHDHSQYHNSCMRLICKLAQRINIFKMYSSGTLGESQLSHWSAMAASNDFNMTSNFTSYQQQALPLSPPPDTRPSHFSNVSSPTSFSGINTVPYQYYQHHYNAFVNGVAPPMLSPPAEKPVTPPKEPHTSAWWNSTGYATPPSHAPSTYHYHHYENLRVPSVRHVNPPVPQSLPNAVPQDALLQQQSNIAAALLSAQSSVSVRRCRRCRCPNCQDTSRDTSGTKKREHICHVPGCG